MNSGGTATYLNSLIPGLVERGIDAHLLFGNVTEDETEDIHIDPRFYTRMKHLRREISLSSDSLAILEMRNFVKSFQPQIIHSHAFKAGLIARLQLERNTKRIHTFHGHHLYDPEFGSFAIRTMNLLERLLAIRTDGFVFTGERVKKELEEVRVGRGIESACIAPGIEPPRQLIKSMARQKLGLLKCEENQLVVLWLGRFVDVKRPLEFVQLARKFPSSLFLMAGDGPLRRELEEKSPENLIMVGWQDRDTLLAASDITVSTSQSEGMPLSLIESQMSGIPVIAPNVGSISEIVIDSVTGYLVDGSLRELSGKLELLINEASQRMNMSKSAKDFATKKFSIEQLVNSHLDFYDRVLLANAD